MTKPPAPKRCPAAVQGGARLAPLGKWPLEAAFLSVVPGAKETERRQPLQRTPLQSHSAPLTSTEDYFLAMMERSTKRKTTAVPGPDYNAGHHLG
jgi:hypothetical protein